MMAKKINPYLGIFVGILMCLLCVILLSIFPGVIRATAYDISTTESFPMTYVGGEDTDPEDVQFNNDGTKMYVVGDTGNEINEYTLSTAYDVETSSYVDTVSVGVGNPRGMAFNDDGTKMYVVDSGSDDIFEYDLSVAYDVSTASSTHVVDVSGHAGAVTGIDFNSDGTKMVVSDDAGNDINYYTLSTGFDISTASHGGSVSAGDGSPEDVAFNSDGSKMFVLAADARTVREFTLSSSYDASTASFVDAVTLSGIEGSPQGSAFNSDGTKMYIVGRDVDSIFTYTLTTGYDVSATEDFPAFPISFQTTPLGVAFSTSGTKLFITGGGNDNVEEYTLSTPFDIRTATYDSALSTSLETSGTGVTFSTSGTKMFQVGKGADDVYEYALSTPFDISTGSFTTSTDVGSREVTPEDVDFSTDGTKMFITGNAGDDITIYTLSTPFDISTASYDSEFSLSGQGESDPVEMEFNDDGTKMFVLSGAGDIYEYTLSSAFDLSAPSFVDSFDIARPLITPEGFAFGNSGLMFVAIDSSFDYMFSFTLAGDSNTAPTATMGAPSQTAAGIVTATTTVADADSNVTSLIVEYSVDGSTWVSSSLRTVTDTEGVDGVTTSTGNIADIDTDNDGSVNLTVIEWDIAADLPNTDDTTVYLRFTPNDGTINGDMVSSTAFAIDTADPTVPGALTIDSRTTSTLVLGYPTTTSTDTNFSEYIVYYSTSTPVTTGDTAFTSTTDANLGDSNFNGATTSSPITSLTPNTTYYMTLFAYDIWANSTSSASEASTTTEANVPVSLAATGASTSQIDLSWGANSNPSGTVYEVRLSDDTFIATTTATSYSHTGRDVNTEYTYKVRAQNSAGVYTAYTSNASAYTLAAQAGQPSAVVSSTTALRITFGSDANPTNTTYALYNVTDGNYLAANGSSNGGTPVYQTTSTWGTVDATGLSINTSYQFSAIARNGDTISSATSTASTAIYTLANIPVSLAVGGETSSTLDISWGANSNPGSTVYELRLDDDSLVTSTLSTSYTHTGLDSATTYTYKVRALNGDSVATAYTSTADGTTLAVPPDAPSGITTSTVATSSITMSWTDNSNNETSFLFDYVQSTSAGDFPGTTSSLAANTTSTSITGLTPNTAYLFRVAAVNAEGTSSYTTSTVVYTDPEIPGTPSVALVSSSSLSVAWDGGANSTSTIYEVYNVTAAALSATTTATSTTVTGLDVNSPYQFIVRAQRAGDSGVSAYSPTSTAVYTAAAIPTNLVLSSVTTSSISTAWDDNSNPGGTQYELRLSDDTLVTSTTSTSHTHTGLSLNTTYTYKVRALNGDSVATSYSSTAATTTLSGIPLAPTDMATGTITTSSIYIDWTDNSSDELSFLFDYIVGTDTGDFPGTTTSLSANTVFTTTNGLAPNTAHIFRVASVGYGGASSYATSSVVYTLATTPGTPTITATGATTLSVAWNANSNGSSSVYEIYNVTDGAVAATTTATSASITGLIPNTSYQFKVRVENLGAPGTYTSYTADSSAVYTHAAAPGTVTAAATGENTATVTWVDTSNPTTTEFAIYESNNTNYVNSSTLAIGASSPQWTITSTWFGSGDPLTVTGLATGTEYCFGVAARNADSVETTTTTASCITTTAASSSGSSSSSTSDGGGSALSGGARNLPTVASNGRLTINGGALSTEKREVVITLPQTNADLMAISEDPAFTRASFVPYKRSSSFSVSIGDGSKTVYVKLKKNNGGALLLSDSIELVGQGFDAPDTATPSDDTCPLPVRRAYKTDTSPSVYYVTEQCTRRAFAKADKYATYFPTGSPIPPNTDLPTIPTPDWSKVTTDNTIATIQNDGLGFMPWGPYYNPQYGALVKQPADPKVYLLLNGKKYWISSGEIFTALGYQNSWIEDVDATLLNRYATGAEINYTDHHPEFTIIKYPALPEIYRIELLQGTLKKRWIPTPAAFHALNFRADRVITIDVSEQYEDGPELEAPPSSYTFTLFLSNGSRGVEVKELQLRLQQLGYFPADVAPNGNFGPATEQAVKAFQAANGIEQAGYVGPGTRAALNQ